MAATERDEALEDARSTRDTFCEAPAPKNDRGAFGCCRSPGHTGEHVSVTGNGRLLLRWSASATMEREEFKAKVDAAMNAAARRRGVSNGAGTWKEAESAAAECAEARTAVLDAYAAAEARVKVLEEALRNVTSLLSAYAGHVRDGVVDFALESASAALPAPTKEDSRG